MPRWLFWDIDDTATAVGLLCIALVVLIWGTALVVDAYRMRGDRRRPRWHPRRWLPLCFAFWLGWFLIISDGGIYAILATDLFRDPDGVDLWVFVYILLCTLLAIIAFFAWARERLPRSAA